MFDPEGGDGSPGQVPMGLIKLYGQSLERRASQYPEEMFLNPVDMAQEIDHYGAGEPIEQHPGGQLSSDAPGAFPGGFPGAAPGAAPGGLPGAASKAQRKEQLGMLLRERAAERQAAIEKWKSKFPKMSDLGK